MDEVSRRDLERRREARKRELRRKSRLKAPADFRAENEDDDGYDPYSDYMDALARSDYEEPSEDPWK